MNNALLDLFNPPKVKEAWGGVAKEYVPVEKLEMGTIRTSRGEIYEKSMEILESSDGWVSSLKIGMILGVGANRVNGGLKKALLRLGDEASFEKKVVMRDYGKGQTRLTMYRLLDRE